MAYRKPNTHQIPNEVCDKHMKDLSGSEFKVLYLIARKTCGFHKDAEALGADRICRYTGLSKEAVRSAAKSLEGQGLICRELQHDVESKTYSDTLYWLAMDDDEGQPPLPQKLGEGTPDSRGPLPQNLGSIIGTKETLIETSGNTPVAPAENPEQTNATLDLDDDPATFIQNAYRRGNRRAKLDNLKARAGERTLSRIIQAEAEYGPETFRSALLTYLSSDNEKVVRARWPIRMFLDHVDWHIPASEYSPRSCAPRAAHSIAEPSEDMSGHPESADAAAGLKNGVSAPQVSYPDRWNELVPEAKVDPVLLARNPKAYSDPVFAARFDEICQKASTLIAAGADLKFGFLLKTDAKTERYRWQELLADELDWMKPRVKAAKPDPFANLRKELAGL